MLINVDDPTVHIITFILHVKAAIILRITLCTIFKLLSIVSLNSCTALCLLVKTNSKKLKKTCKKQLLYYEHTLWQAASTFIQTSDDFISNRKYTQVFLGKEIRKEIIMTRTELQ